MIRHTILVLALLFGGQTLAAENKRIAITIDDVPIVSVKPSITMEMIEQTNTDLLAALKKHEVEAVGFVNEARVLRPNETDRGMAVLTQWLTSGMELGNHTFDHVGMHTTPLIAYQDAVIKGEALTRMLTEKHNKPLRYFRHPYTQTGNSVHDKKAFEAFLSQRGYQVAPFTIEHSDYLFACVYDKLTKTTDKQRVVDEYLAHLRDTVGVYETMSEELFGRQIPQILLIHDSQLNADTLDQTLTTLKDMGYTFITLEEAMTDDAYKIDDIPSKRFGPSWFTRWAKTLKKKLSIYGHRDPSGFTAKQAKVLCAN